MAVHRRALITWRRTQSAIRVRGLSSSARCALSQPIVTPQFSSRKSWTHSLRVTFLMLMSAPLDGAGA